MMKNTVFFIIYTVAPDCTIYHPKIIFNTLEVLWSITTVERTNYPEVPIEPDAKWLKE